MDLKLKIQFHEKDKAAVLSFLHGWLDFESPMFKLMLFEECEPIYLDCEATELLNCFMELNKKGFTQSVKEIFQGSHFYRSDTGKCPRCYRYRPEIHWNNENIPECEAKICDRCASVIFNNGEDLR